MAHTLLDYSILSASEYNTIPLIEDQPAIRREHLEQLGKIIVENGVQHEWCVAMLHRHIAIGLGNAMVHECPRVDIDICREKSVTATALYQPALTPNSYFLNSEGKFQGYEYANGPWSVPPPIFLRQFRDFLVHEKLERLVALVAENTLGDSVEYLLPNRQGTVCVPRKKEYTNEDDTSISTVTCWKFSEAADGSIRCEGVQTCEQQGDGQHEIKNT